MISGIDDPAQYVLVLFWDILAATLGYPFFC